MSVDPKHLGQQLANIGLMEQNIALLGLVRAKQEGLNIANSLPKAHVQEHDSDDVHFGKLRIEELEREKEAAYQALREAQEITKEWQSAMEAWRDLAQTLRNEVKACPNHEAHQFGKDIEAVRAKVNASEDQARTKHGLPAKYTAKK